MSLHGAGVLTFVGHSYWLQLSNNNYMMAVCVCHWVDLYRNHKQYDFCLKFPKSAINRSYGGACAGQKEKVRMKES